MACSEGLGKQLNDVEIVDILSNDGKVSSDVREKPLSPILSGGLNNRKHLRISHKRSARVKLSNRFKKNDTEERLLVNPINVSIPLTFNDSLSASQSKILVDHLDKLEELDICRKKLYKALVRNDKNNDCFKRPKSHVEIKINNDKKRVKNENDSSINVRSENCFQKSMVDEIIPNSENKLKIGFQTAKGTTISVCDSDVKKYSKLFEDIIYPTNIEARQNKHTLLKRNDYVNNNENNSNVSNDLNMRSLGCLKSDKKLKSEQSNFVPNYSKSNLDIKTENAVNRAKQFFADEDLNDIKFNNEHFDGFKKATTKILNTPKNNDNNLRTDKNMELSLTQAICDSEISNTQILNAVDNMLYSIDENDKDFRGFTVEDVKESCTKHLCMKKLLQHNNSASEFPKKRKIDYFNEDYRYNIEEIKNIKQTNPPNKKVRYYEEILDNTCHIQNKENTLLMKGSNIGGFKCASGKSISISDKYMKDAEGIFGDIGFKLPNEENKHFVRNVKESFPSKKKIRNYEEILNNISKENSMPMEGFKSASGKSISVSEKYIENAESVFKDIDVKLPKKQLDPKFGNVYPEVKNLIKNCSFVNFRKASGKSIEVSEKSHEKVKNIFNKLDEDSCTDNDDNKLLPGKYNNVGNKSSNILKEKFRTRKYLGESTTESTDHIENENDNEAKCLQRNINPDTSPTLIQKSLSSSTTGFCKASGKAVRITENFLDKAKHLFENLNIDQFDQSDDDRTLIGHTSPSFSIHTEESGIKSASLAENTDISSTFSIIKENTVIETTPVSLHKPKVSILSSKSSKRKLGVSHFKPIQISDNKLNKAKLLFEEDLPGISPMKPKQSTTYTSTPIKQDNNLSSVNNNYVRAKNSFATFMDAASITPIKVNVVENKKQDINFSTKSSNILCTSPSTVNWIDDLETERKKLEMRWQVLLEREKLGKKMLHCLKMGKMDGDKKPKRGLLCERKTAGSKISLVNFVNNKRPGDDVNELYSINQENAENLHFVKQVSPYIETQDGAIVIPNSKDMVGLTEIKTAFEAMPGVDPQLIPKRWVENHYKWIIWKLASYENKFPHYFAECLNIETVVQQLKYRYDREIDRAERSALRKICEKDDIPQRRMVLFVSDIKKLDMRKYELELCDGWYALRTVIDEPLCNQIINGKIEIGTKLAISGAELLNCDGCHPLEATNLTCLKINCNSTRRAVWHAKLGYQLNSNPFPIQLQGIYPCGGTIAAIKVCIARVYPLRYMERLQNRSVWRNKKAEELAAQKWENERSSKLEQIQHEVSKKFEHSYTKPINGPQLNSDVSSIKCPKTLYEIFERSNDPECLQQKLSVSQKEAILDYQSNLSIRKQEQIAAEVSAGVSKMKIVKRDVVAILKLLIFDVIGDSDKLFNFFIWRPTEAHLQSLKEEKSFTIQNVSPKPNGDLNSTVKTTFKLETGSSSKCMKYKRRLMQLSELITLNFLPYFNEFDTLGIVVQTKIESDIQEVWIADNAGRLLFITIHEGPSSCSLLDNLKRGQTTTICNLIYRGLKKEVIQAVANHFTVFSSYSQHRHLQEGLEIFKKELAKDVPKLLNDCDSRIEVFRIISDINSFSENFEDTLICSESSLQT